MCVTALFVLAFASAAAGSPVVVFPPAPNVCFRIPSLVQTPGGLLLAFTEARWGPGTPPNGCNDDGGGHNLVLKRSADGGATWGPLLTAVGNASNLAPGGTGFTNPSPLVVVRAGGAHRILLHFATYNNPCATQHGRTLQTWSDDDGLTWSVPEDITAQLRPELPGALPGPQRGVQRGDRLIFTAWGNNATCPFNPDSRDGFSAFVYSSADLGSTWAPLDALAEGTNECALGLRADDSLLVLCRSTGVIAGPILRTVYAPDLASRTALAPAPLVTPTCEGSLTVRGSALYFSNPSQ